MRILFFGDCAAEHLRRWSKFFASLGHDVHVITWNTFVLDGFAPVHVHLVQKYKHLGSSIAGRLVNFMVLISQVRRRVREINPDIIHAHSAGAYAWLTMFTGFHPFVVTPWGNDVLVSINRSWIEKFLTVCSLKRAALVHCDGENTKEAMIHLGIAPRKIVILTFGVDINKFSPGKPSANFYEEYDLAGFNVVMSSRTLNPIHNVETVIRTVPLVLKKVPNTKFFIVGSGMEDQMLRHLSDSLGVSHAVVFVGRVEEDQMVDCLRSAAIYVSTSLSESGLAASTAEAMACGLPIINTDTGDIRLWIGEHKGGFIVPIKEPKTLAGKIIYLLQHEAIRHQFGTLNRITIEDRNNVYIEMRKMEAIYKDVVEHHKIK